MTLQLSIISLFLKISTCLLFILLYYFINIWCSIYMVLQSKLFSFWFGVYRATLLYRWLIGRTFNDKIKGSNTSIIDYLMNDDVECTTIVLLVLCHYVQIMTNFILHHHQSIIILHILSIWIVVGYDWFELECVHVL